jgi:nucleoside-diphosphate-sugar epimerase
VIEGARFLVTGGAGFIGSHLVEHLVANGASVVVLDDFSTGKSENLEPVRGRISLIEASVTDAAACARAIDGVEYVLHQAAIPSVPRSIAEPEASNAVNVNGTLNVLLAAKTAGVRRVVYAASSSAYGDTDELPKREEMAGRPLSPYAAAKLAGESYCRAFYTSYGLETVALRYFNIFGPRQDPASQYAAAVPRFITAALSGGRVTIYGDGEQTRDFTYVRNVVNANLLACSAPAERVAGGVFNVGAGERTSVNELWSMIQELAGRDDAVAEHTPARAGDVRDSLASLQNAERLLGYTPAVGLREGLAATVEFFRSRARADEVVSAHA